MNTEKKTCCKDKECCAQNKCGTNECRCKSKLFDDVDLDALIEKKFEAFNDGW